MAEIVPAQYQPPLPLDKLILQDGAEGAADRMELDVLIVGAGPAGLACAIELARLARSDATELNIGVLDKAEALGEHSLSGAVVNPRAFRELFPDLKDSDFPFRTPVSKEAVYVLTAAGKWRLPIPPSMRNHGNYIASLCEIVRWLGAKAEAVGVGVGYRDAGVDVHVLLQQLKRHPLLRELLAGGEMVEWGAKTMPEGGFYSLPQRRAGGGVVLLGDAAGFVDVPSLKGIHYAMQSGIYAGRAILQNLKNGTKLTEYDRLVNASYIARDLYRTRNMRLAFRDGFYLGGLQAGLMTLTGGRFPGGKYEMHADADVPRTLRFAPTRPSGVSKVDAVFKSGNSTRDSIPSHLIAAQDVSGDVARFYSHVCPAGVYEATENGLRINAPNCVDCKATDVLGPRWTPREGGSGPRYKRM